MDKNGETPQKKPRHTGFLIQRSPRRRGVIFKMVTSIGRFINFVSSLFYYDAEDTFEERIFERERLLLATDLAITTLNKARTKLSTKIKDMENKGIDQNTNICSSTDPQHANNVSKARADRLNQKQSTSGSETDSSENASNRSFKKPSKAQAIQQSRDLMHKMGENCGAFLGRVETCCSIYDENHKLLNYLMGHLRIAEEQIDRLNGARTEINNDIKNMKQNTNDSANSTDVTPPEQSNDANLDPQSTGVSVVSMAPSQTVSSMN